MVLRAFRTAIPEMWLRPHTVGMAKQNRNRQQMTESPRIRHVTVLATTLDEWAGEGY